MMKKVLLVISSIILSIGNVGGPLLMRLYFIHGGKRVWLSSWLQTAGWPITLIPLTIAYFHRRFTKGSTQLFYMKFPLFIASALIGIITGLDDYLYAYGMARLPVSTSSLIIAAQLGCTAAFAYFLVKQKFTPYSVNAVVLLTVGAGVLALHTNGDRPANESSKQYFAGFFMTVAAAVLYGFILPLLEFVYLKLKEDISYTLVMEVQIVMCFFATLFCTVGMLVNNDFKAIPREARNSSLGEVNYYVVLAWSGIVCQFFFIGVTGVIFCGSSLLSGIIISVLLPLTEILAVVFFKEKFQAEKGVALVLSLWGFASYFYGEIINHSKKSDQKNQNSESEVHHIQIS